MSDISKAGLLNVRSLPERRAHRLMSAFMDRRTYPLQRTKLASITFTQTFWPSFKYQWWDLGSWDVIFATGQTGSRLWNLFMGLTGNFPGGPVS